MLNSLTIISHSLGTQPLALAAIARGANFSVDLSTLWTATPPYVELIAAKQLEDVWNSPLPSPTRAYLTELFRGILSIDHLTDDTPWMSVLSYVASSLRWIGLYDVETLVARANVQLIAMNVELTHLFRQRDLWMQWTAFMVFGWVVSKMWTSLKKSIQFPLFFKFNLLKKKKDGIKQINGDPVSQVDACDAALR